MKVFGVTLSGQAGLAFDKKGNVAAYAQGAAPVATNTISAAKTVMGKPASTLTKDTITSTPKAKAFEGLGLTMATSNASTVNDLAGKGSYQNASLGAELGGTVEHFSGSDSQKGSYDGIAITVGEVAGGGVDAGGSYTAVSPIGNVSNVPENLQTSVPNAIQSGVNQIEVAKDASIKDIIRRNGG